MARRVTPEQPLTAAGIPPYSAMTARQQARWDAAWVRVLEILDRHDEQAQQQAEQPAARAA